MNAAELGAQKPVIVPPESIRIRPVEERDIPQIIGLLKLNYGDDYPDRELYDSECVKRAILNQNVHWLVAEWIVNQEVLAAGAIKLDYGDFDDQLGLIGRLVAHPQRRSGTLVSLGSMIVKRLVKDAKTRVECIIGDARTSASASQRMVEHEGLKAVGFLPYYKFVMKEPESLVLYAALYEGGQTLRSNRLPQVLEAVELLAFHALSELSLSTALMVIKRCPAYPNEDGYTFVNADTQSLARLRQISRPLASAPVVFANVTSNYGVAVLADRQIYHMVAVVDEQVVGGLGYKFDQNNAIFQITELVFNNEELINALCHEAVNIAARLQARIVEVDVSAYDPRIQQTFVDYGFHAVAYIPAMVCYHNARLDVIKMFRLNMPYNTRNMELTPQATKVTSLIESTLGTTQL